MKAKTVSITLHSGYVLIISEPIINLFAKLSGFDGKHGTKQAMGIALFPFFIILRNLEHPMTPQWLIHEQIHLRQFWESFGFFWIYAQLEYWYMRLFTSSSHKDAYLYECVEQEAYQNQTNPNYLSERKWWSTLKYMQKENKRRIVSNESYQITISDY